MNGITELQVANIFLIMVEGSMIFGSLLGILSRAFNKIL